MGRGGFNAFLKTDRWRQLKYRKQTRPPSVQVLSAERANGGKRRLCCRCEVTKSRFRRFTPQNPPLYLYFLETSVPGDNKRGEGVPLRGCHIGRANLPRSRFAQMLRSE